MKKYMIEREIPKVGTLQREQLREAAGKSNEVLGHCHPLANNGAESNGGIPREHHGAAGRIRADE